jgi:hypothetical protein
MTTCGIPFQIAAASSADPILRSNYRDQVFAVREKRDLNLIEITGIVERIRQERKLDEVIILPSTEYLNRFLMRHRDKLGAAGANIPLVDASLYDRLSDKEAFAEICTMAGLPVPRVVEPGTIEAFPVVAKPRRYFSGDGGVQGKPRILHCREDLNQFLQSENSDDFLFQEFLNGRSFYLLYHLSKNGPAVRYSQANLAQQKNGGSILAAKGAELHHESIADRYEILFRQLGFSGLVMVELREARNDFYMIEANPRLWGPSQLFVDANVPIFRQFFSDLGFDVPLPTSRREHVQPLYFWLGGFGAKMMTSADFHGGLADQIMDEFRDYLIHDVYLRPDTLEIFHNEIKNI